MSSKLPLNQKIGYGLGDIGSNIFIVTTGMFLLFFMTNVLGVEPALAGLALLVPKLWDVISDPIMGAISDLTHSRWGRRRPYLLYASIPFGLVFFALFIAPNTSSQIATVFWVGALFALSCTVFTIYNIPYSAMVAEMTDDYNERMSITSFRMVGSSIGVLLAGGLAMPLVDMGGGGAAGFRFMGMLLGVLISLFSLAGFWGTRGTKTLVAEKSMVPIKEQIRIAFRNTPFKLLMSMYTLQSLAIGILMAGQIYYVKYVMNMPESYVGLVSGVLFITAIVFIPVWVRIGVKLGKIRAYKIGIGILVVMLFSLLFTQPSQSKLFLMQMFFLGIGFSSFQLFPFSMLPDTIEFDELQSSLRREGIFSGVWASGQKTAYALGPSLIGFTLSFSGFRVNAEQGASVSMGIRLVFCIFTAVLFLISLIPFHYYDLTESRFAEIINRIRASSRA
ncbi:MAG: glycoside-pentoside-hexuronide (GPH):cation symporter [Candidatus Marinimicrobia bacterium]|nr:glycoside-pentoside-hexuronide (GPH):cation symporter [Candidatus Neomarinimicrobiota bacterium]